MGLITETNAQYYSGQQVFPALVNKTNPTFTCTFNTDVVSAYDSSGNQISSSSNYTIYFNGVENGLPRAPWDVAFTIMRNDFRGRVSLQMNVRAIRAAE